MTTRESRETQGQREKEGNKRKEINNSFLELYLLKLFVRKLFLTVSMEVATF
jgi:hypothetical protein